MTPTAAPTPKAKAKAHTPTVSAAIAPSGTDTAVTVSGTGPGRHVVGVRLWPGGIEVAAHVFDDDGTTLTIPGTHDRGVASVDGAGEIRFDVEAA